MNRYLLSSALVLSLFAACNSSDDGDPANVASAGSDDGGTAGESDAAGGSTSGKTSSAGQAGNPDSVGGTPAVGGASAGTSATSAGAAGDTTTAASGGEGSGGAGSDAPACDIPETLVGSCAKKNLDGTFKSCVVYWGSAFTADALKAACPSEPTLGANICPSEGSVGACETSSGPTALANYYYNAADGTPANQAQCNANTGHKWCSPQ